MLGNREPETPVDSFVNAHDAEEVLYHSTPIIGLVHEEITEQDQEDEYQWRGAIAENEENHESDCSDEEEHKDPNQRVEVIGEESEETSSQRQDDNDDSGEDEDESQDYTTESGSEDSDESSDYNVDDTWKISRNITISRDQTQGSSHDLEKLSILRNRINELETSWPLAQWTGGSLLACSSGNTINIWDSETGLYISGLSGHSSTIFTLSWWSDSNQLASGASDGTIRIWDLNTGQCQVTLLGHESDIRCLSWSVDGRLASASDDYTIKIWDKDTDQCIKTLTRHEFWVLCVSWSVDGRLASSSADRTIKIWDKDTYKCIKTLTGHTDWVNCVSWSVDGILASGSDDHTIRIWEKNHLYSSTLKGHTGDVECLAWSKNGRLASGSADHTIKIWEERIYQCGRTLETSDRVDSVAWSEDDRRLVSTSGKEFMVWDTATGLISLKIEESQYLYGLTWLENVDRNHIARKTRPPHFSKPVFASTLDGSIHIPSDTQNNRVYNLPGNEHLFRISSAQLVKPTSNYPNSAVTLSSQSVKIIPATKDISFPPLIDRSNRKMADFSSNSAVSVTAPGMAGLSWEQMQCRLAQLEEENQMLKVKPQSPASLIFQIFHLIEGDKTTYLSAPSWTNVTKDMFELKGHSPIPDSRSYLARRPEIAFAVYKFYDPENQREAVKRAWIEAVALPDSRPYKEIVDLLSDDMIVSAEAFCQAQPDFRQDFPEWDPHCIPSPFVFWYKYRGDTSIDNLPDGTMKHIKLLTDWIENNYGALYSEVEKEFSLGYISSPAMPFFVRPREVLVFKQNNDIGGLISSSWARQVSIKVRKREESDGKEETMETWKVESWSYGYDGQFFRKPSQLDIVLTLDQEHQKVEISTLDVLPLRFAGEATQRLLERRGHAIWKCRFKNLVSYEGDKDSPLYGHGERFMIDYATYKQLHLDSQNFRKVFPHLHMKNRKEIQPEVMKLEEPPSVPERLVFPSTIIGYNLHQKKWLDLKVDRIRDVHWNEEAFEHLVVDDETKVLIRALVSSKLEADEGTDVIEGKGNGLIVLLHGGPGTGKTFTAESVAEIARKPLYRVTCGDIGTQPQEVEKYLESVLYLGKIWDCVVLLDEADVFLEQRTLNDLERNALVSVFLRVLEYYEGILILTSNRVGTFDEAFKSRIQLSLHYEALTESQRSTIWKNFFTKLKAAEVSAGQEANRSIDAGSSNGIAANGVRSQQLGRIDFVDIERHIEKLAKIEMNGRQIRNIITTGRQLAKYEGASMSYYHLKRVIKISSKFDNYLKKVTGNTDDDAAREDGRR